MSSTPQNNNGSAAKRQAAGSGDPRRAQAKQQAGRDENGRFAKGNAGGPGNPFARRVAALRKALVSFVTEDDIKEIGLVLMERAKMGDTAAVKLLFQYSLGKPGAAADPDRVDIDEWQLLQAKSRPVAEMDAVMNGLPVDKITNLTGTLLPCKFQSQFADPLLAGIAELDRRDAERKKNKHKDDNVPAAIVDRLALGGLGEPGQMLAGEAPWAAPSANERNGRRHRKGKRARNGKRR